MKETSHPFFVFVSCNYTLTHKYVTRALTVSSPSQCCSALSVGDGNVSVLGHRHVPGDTASPGCIHRQHRGGPVSAQRPGVMQTLFSHSLYLLYYTFIFYFCMLIHMQSRCDDTSLLSFYFRDAQWTQLTSRGRQRFTLPQRGVE